MTTLMKNSCSDVERQYLFLELFEYRITKKRIFPMSELIPETPRKNVAVGARA